MPTEGTPSSGSGFQQADTLWNRTYIGLLISQFLAAFNDQAIHASAMFFAINTQTLTEAKAISLMPILFYAPWAIFCTVAGYLADRYSKRVSLVFWKFSEIAITALALLGFWLGTHDYPQLGSWIVLSTVFLMGTHSAFFVPAKYGVMPEILKPHLLSKGNGLLESLSFLAVILGTVSGGVLSFLFLREETIIGVILLVLAVVGALASLMIQRMPAANPQREFPQYIYKPLWNSLKTLFSSRPLIFAVIGLAFFTFIVAFMRATVYMLGESQNPRWDELRTSAIVGTVALGIGLGSPLAGRLSGHKIELGLIPLGALGMVIGCIAASTMLGYVPGLILFIVLIGFSTGFYLVPLFTLLQHRAPKSSKGDMVATSNFLNVTGAIAASALFFVLVAISKQTGFVPKVDPQDRYAEGKLTHREFLRGRPVYCEITAENGTVFQAGKKPNPAEPPPSVGEQLFGGSGAKDHAEFPHIEIGREVAPGDQVVVSRYLLHGVEHLGVRKADAPLEPQYDATHLPRFLFIGAGLMTLATLLLLILRLPDLPSRGLRVWRSLVGRSVHVHGVHHIASTGPLVLVVNRSEPEVMDAVTAASDRYTRRVSGDLNHLDQAQRMLQAGQLVTISLADPGAEEFLVGLKQRVSGVSVIPVFAELDPKMVKVEMGEAVHQWSNLAELRDRVEATRPK